MGLLPSFIVDFIVFIIYSTVAQYVEVKSFINKVELIIFLYSPNIASSDQADAACKDAQTHLADKRTERSRTSVCVCVCVCVYLHRCVDSVRAATAFSAQTSREPTHIVQTGADVRQEGAERPLMVRRRTALNLLQAEAAERVTAA